MARLPRLNLPNIPQHVVQRGNNRQLCFFAEQDYKIYFDKLNFYAQKFQVKVHAYVLMTNHVHLLLTPVTEKGVSQLMQSLGRYYVRYINHTYCRTGTLWEGRYKSTLVDSENYFLVVSRYIELNPVRANIVLVPSAYLWSSFHHNALGKTSRLITPHYCYQMLGVNSELRQQAYHALFHQHISPKNFIEIQQATNKAWVLGSKRFKAQIEQQTGRRASPLARGGDKKSFIYQENK
ncbi:transposase [Colwellia sp. C1TZA3]|uniref:transposase n=1 Tax=Colwellia sp. C1TZA3 TaxID=2508879 RepID=UPI0011BA1153|nr:transposase [Colwellia sp. C1TZA3]TWX72898.1 transposase [Colwellia sp. C1TZA3]